MSIIFSKSSSETASGSATLDCHSLETRLMNAIIIIVMGLKITESTYIGIATATEKLSANCFASTLGIISPKVSTKRVITSVATHAYPAPR